VKRLSLVLISSLAIAGCNGNPADPQKPKVATPITEANLSVSEWNSLTPASDVLELRIPANEAIFNKVLNGTDLVDVTSQQRQQAVAKLNADGVAYRQAIMALNACSLTANRTQTGNAERPKDTQVTQAVLESVGPDCTYPARFSNALTSTINKITIDPVTKKPSYLDTSITRVQKVSQVIDNALIQTFTGMKSYSYTLQESGQKINYRQNNIPVMGLSLRGTGVLTYVSTAGETIVVSIQTQVSNTTKGHWATVTANATTSKGSIKYEATKTWDGNQAVTSVRVNDATFGGSVNLLSEITESIY